MAKDYDFLAKNVPLYSERNRLIAEIDLMGVKGDYCDIYEVKCSHRIIKAKHQLTKIKNKFSLYKIRKTLFFCGSSGALVAVH